MVQFSSLYGGRLDRELGTDDTRILFTTARRQSAINEGLAEFASLTRCFPRTSTLAIVGGTREYDLNATITSTGPGPVTVTESDFERLGLDGVEFLYTDASSNITALRGDDLVRKDLDWLNVYEPGWRESTTASTVMQLPRYYYLRPDGGSLWLGFVPVPSTGSSASATAIVHYLAQPAALTVDSQEPYTVAGVSRKDLRPYAQASVHYAAAQLEKLRKDRVASGQQMQQFLGYVQRYLATTTVLVNRTVTQARSYFSEIRRQRVQNLPDRPSSLR